MSDAVVVALIGLAGSGLGSVPGILGSNKLTQYRLEQMIKVESHRIDDMENFRKPGQEARA